MTDLPLEFDRFLDVRAASSGGSIDEPLDGFATTVTWLEARASQINPDAEFARSLRRTLLIEETTDLAIQSLATSAVVQEFSPLPLPSRRRKYVEVAAILLLLLPAFWLLGARRDSAVLDEQEGDSAISIGASASSNATAEAIPEPMVWTVPLFRVGATLSVAIDVAQLRTGPSFDAPSVRNLAKGSRLVVLAIAPDPAVHRFVWAEAQGGLRGWIWMDALEYNQSEAATQAAIATSGIQSTDGGTNPTLPPDAGSWLATPSATPGAEWQTSLRAAQNEENTPWIHGDLVEVVRSTFFRSEPGPNGHVRRSFAPGDRLWFLGGWIGTTDAVWLDVELPGSGQRGWVDLDDVAIVSGYGTELSPSPAIVATVTPVIVGGESVLSTGDIVFTNIEMPLQAEPRSSSDVVAMLPANRALELSGESVTSGAGTTWLPVVVVVTGQKGWVKLSSVHVNATIQEIESGEIVTASADAVRIRVQPSESANLVTTVNKGAELIVLQVEPENGNGERWLHVRVAATGEEGWIAQAFVRVSIAEFGGNVITPYAASTPESSSQPAIRPGDG